LVLLNLAILLLGWHTLDDWTTGRLD